MLSDFLKEHRISLEALVAASRAIEGWSPEERTLMAARIRARREKKTYAELSLAKPKARGRGVTPAVIQRALAGEPVTRLVRQKIVRAVNAQLASAKKDQVDWRPLFADAKAKKGKKKK